MKEKRTAAEEKYVGGSFNERARPVLDLIDDLRKIGVQKCVPIPQIAVMGDQSSGKSSVLEAISGISFPRGAGLCTRCPTQVTMSHGTVWTAIVRAEGHDPVELEDGEQGKIPQVIENFTTKLAGAKSLGGFSKSEEYIEIVLKSPDVPDLTIIDLPGIVQSEEVKARVDGMLERFLKQERTIILAVIPSNVDIATVDILERAKKVDPKFKRTIGVLTKPDLVDKGAESEVIEVLANRLKPMSHGYYMLKNRSQQELDSNDPPEVARRREFEWLKNSKYAQVNEKRLGVHNLTTALTDLLVDRIEQALPAMSKEVDTAFRKTTKELALLGKPSPKTGAQCREAVGEVISNFCKMFRKTCSESLPGKAEGGKEGGVLYKELRLRKTFVNEIKKSRPGFDGENDRYDIQVVSTANSSSGKRDSGVNHLSAGSVVKGCNLTNTKASKKGLKAGDEFEVGYYTYGFSKGKILEVNPCFRKDIGKRMEDRRGREMRGFMSWPVFCEIMAEFVELWKEPMERYHTNLVSAIIENVSNILRSLSAEWPRVSTAIEAELMKIVEETESDTADHLNDVLELEKSPGTENECFWESIDMLRNERNGEALEKIVQRIPGVHNDEKVASTAEVQKHFRSNVSRADVESHLNQEVTDMIDFLKAYWCLSHTRFVDVVYRNIAAKYTGPKVLDAIEKRLLRILVHGAEGHELQRLFPANTRREERRADLEEQVTSLRQARERIRRGIYYLARD